MQNFSLNTSTPVLLLTYQVKKKTRLVYFIIHHFTGCISFCQFFFLRFFLPGFIFAQVANSAPSRTWTPPLNIVLSLLRHRWRALKQTITLHPIINCLPKHRRWQTRHLPPPEETEHYLVCNPHPEADHSEPVVWPVLSLPPWGLESALLLTTTEEGQWEHHGR